MAFNRSSVAELLARCRRRCCVCHRFCGVKIETDHIEPKTDEGDDDIANAIPVCFDCHAEIHSYNERHPRGRKFTADELRLHKKQWLEVCDTMPDQLLAEHRSSDAEVGPIQAMIDEIEFNRAAARAGAEHRSGCPLRDEQFARAIRSGSPSLLLPELKTVIIDAYVAAGHASVIGQAAAAKRAGGMPGSVSGSGSTDPVEAFRNCELLLTKAQEELLKFLGHPEEAG